MLMSEGEMWSFHQTEAELDCFISGGILNTEHGHLWARGEKDAWMEESGSDQKSIKNKRSEPTFQLSNQHMIGEANGRD